MSWNWYDEGEISAWEQQEELALKAAIGAILKARAKAQAEEENNA